MRGETRPRETPRQPRLAAHHEARRPPGGRVRGEHSQTTRPAGLQLASGDRAAHRPTRHAETCGDLLSPKHRERLKVIERCLTGWRHQQVAARGRDLQTPGNKIPAVAGTPDEAL